MGTSLRKGPFWKILAAFDVGLLNWKILIWLYAVVIHDMHQFLQDSLLSNQSDARKLDFMDKSETATYRMRVETLAWSVQQWK